MEFRTAIKIKPEKPAVEYNSKIFLLGSCFVENISKKLDHYRIQNLSNPFGILYHPYSIENFLKRVVSESQFKEEDIFCYNNRWVSYEAHSQISSDSQEGLISMLNTNIKDTRDFLQGTSHCFITLGTSWFYRNNNSRVPVANCHKIPQRNFSKEIMGLDELRIVLQNIISLVRSINPETTLIFTISPVRHLKDGMIGNQRSKSNLISVLHEVLENSHDENLKYFPSYEILMDDLRDYRFYGRDMLHPSEEAVEYVWKLLVETYFSAEAIEVMQKVEKVQKDLSHRPFNPASPKHLEFRNKLEQKIQNLQEFYPHLKFPNFS